MAIKNIINSELLKEGAGTLKNVYVNSVGKGSYIVYDSLGEGTPGGAYGVSTMTIDTNPTGGTYPKTYLTSTNTDVVEGNTITIGSNTYRFMSVSFDDMVANDIRIGSTPQETLNNLLAAINRIGDETTQYGIETLPHPEVKAFSTGPLELLIVGKVIGDDYNDLETSSATTELLFEDVVLGGGSGRSVIGITPEVINLGFQTYELVGDNELEELIFPEAITKQQIVVGADKETTLLHIKDAVNAGEEYNYAYSKNCRQHPEIEAINSDGSTITFYTRRVGFNQNNIAVSSTSRDITFDNTTFHGAMDDAKIMIGQRSPDGIATHVYNEEFTNGLYITIISDIDISVSFE